MVAALDTHRIVKRLRDAGFSESQAETVTDVLWETRGADFGLLATKADIADMATKAFVRSELRETELRLEGKIEAAKAELFKWLVGLLLGQAALIATLVRLL